MENLRPRKLNKARRAQLLPSAVPLKPHLGILGHKWAIIILTDVGLRNIDRFSELLRSNPALSSRVLSLRLRELEEAGMIKRIGKDRPPRPVKWKTTEKGLDLLPALVRLIAFGARWDAENPFKDRLPRRLTK